MVKVKEDKDDSKDIDIFTSALVPKHEILSGEEKARLLETLNVIPKQLPKIKKDDPAVLLLGAQKGDIIRITRQSHTAGEYYYYRVVI
jgi:DNA-directed RNA polymerase subunit H